MNKELKLRAIVLVSIVFILISFLGLHGTLSSGFHFVDDHEVIQMNKDLADANGDLFHVITSWVKGDLNGRFRPLYEVNNVIVYTTFGGDFFLMSVFHAFLTAFFIFFFFLTVRKMGFPMLESVVFLLIAFVGDQTSIWWRLGPNESIGMWYLSLTLVSMAYAIKSTKNKTFFRILFCVFGSLTIFCKESFLLLIPPMLLTYISLEKLETENLSWKTAIKKHLPEVVLLAGFMLAAVIFILLKVNTESLGYAGIKEVKFQSYVNTFKQLFLSNRTGAVSIIMFIISVAITYLWSAKRKKIFTIHLIILFITVFIVIPQVFLYAKSGIFERYFLPGILAWALMLSFSLKNINEMVRNKFPGKAFSFILILETVLLFAFIMPIAIKESKEATLFTKEGKEVNTVLSLITSNVNLTSTILFVADPVTDNERTYSFKKYLGGISGLTNMITYAVTPNNPNDYEKFLMLNFNSNFNTLTDKNLVEVIAVFPKLSKKGDSIISNLGFRKNDFYNLKVGSYQLYFRNKMDQNLFSKDYNSEVILPRDTSYNENSFYPDVYVNEGDSVQIIVRPTGEIKAPMSAFLILLDTAHPDNIPVHEQIFGSGEIKITRLITTSIEKPWLIYRNWGRDKSIPSANISLKIVHSLNLNIPVR